MSKGKLIIITGTSGVGKSKLADEIIEHGYFNDQKVEYANKYLMRAPRQEDKGIIYATKEEIEAKCDVILPGYRDGDYIGLNTKDIFDEIDKGKYLIVVSGFMEFLQKVLSQFAKENRLNDILVVGIHGFLIDSSDYTTLGDRRGQNNDNEYNKRFMQSRLFIRQYDEWEDIFDYQVKNFRAKGLIKYDLTDDVYSISNLAVRNIERDSESLKTIRDFITCDLSKSKPVNDDEITIIGSNRQNKSTK